MNNTPHGCLQSLLKIHGGRCFVPKSSAVFSELLAAANKMAETGNVTVNPTNVGVTGFIVTGKDFRVKRLHPDEQEPQAH